MIEWNGHLILDYLIDSEIYVCENCKVRIFHDEREYFYFDYLTKQWNEYSSSCEQQIIENIIKNIIE